MIENLESRRLFAVSFEGGVLTVLGTAEPDHIEGFQSATHLVLSTNGVTTHHKLPGLNRIRIAGGDGADVIILSSKSVTIPSQLEGSRGSDTLSSGKANDMIFGGPGDDYMFGADGNDMLDGNSGSDDFLGGNGARDLASYFGRTANVTVGLGVFADDGEVGEGDNVRTDIEIVYGGSGNDHISTTSGRPVRFFGFAGNDTLIGSLGNDVLDGGEGNDSLMGQGGIDIMIANDGAADIVDGGSGIDTFETDEFDDVRNRP